MANSKDIDKLPFDEINIYYDYLKNISVEFLLVDIRNNQDIIRLFESLPYGSDLWLSNITLFDYPKSL